MFSYISTVLVLYLYPLKRLVEVVLYSIVIQFSLWTPLWEFCLQDGLCLELFIYFVLFTVLHFILSEITAIIRSLPF